MHGEDAVKEHKGKAWEAVVARARHGCARPLLGCTKDVGFFCNDRYDHRVYVESRFEYLIISRNFLNNSRKFLEISRNFVEISKKFVEISMKYPEMPRKILKT